MDWVTDFYQKQGELCGVYSTAVSDYNRDKVAMIARLSGEGRKRILELGAGGGQNAVAAGELGHEVVAVELVESSATHGQKLSADSPNVRVLQGDFYTVTFDEPFDLVCYWDGFGVGSDDDQRRLLRRIAGWLRPGGSALLDIYTPWYAASSDGRGWKIGAAERRYGFDAEGCRWLDSWWPHDAPDQVVTQSLRCYSPADLRLLLAGTGLELAGMQSGGALDWESGRYETSVELGRAMFYTAHLLIAH